MLNVEELRKLGKKLANDPDKIYELTPEQLSELRRHLNPYGNIIKEKKKYANISITNWKDEYLKKFYVTSLIGYLYRLLDEYSPTEPVDNNKNKQIRNTIKLFLDKNFLYNPDSHLRSSHSENSKDPERVPKNTLINDIKAAAQSMPQILNENLCYKTLSAYQIMLESKDTLHHVITNMESNNCDEDAQGLLIKNYVKIKNLVDKLESNITNKAKSDTIYAATIDPPVDLFYNFNRYVSNHYEQLREVCASVYNEKPDFEYSIILYDTFDSKADAEKYKLQHQSDFRADVFTIENDGVTMMGPFKENRARIDFYNKNTETIKAMMEQMEADHKLGKDLMEKSVARKKIKNVKEVGPDDPGLSNYINAINSIRDLGSKQSLTIEEQNKIAQAKSIKDDYEIPDDAIQVDMFCPKIGEDGETILEKKKFYTQAEAPLHMKEGSEFVDKYQPIRTENNETSDNIK